MFLYKITESYSHRFIFVGESLQTDQRLFGTISIKLFHRMTHTVYSVNVQIYFTFTSLMCASHIAHIIVYVHLDDTLDGTSEPKHHCPSYFQVRL